MKKRVSFFVFCTVFVYMLLLSLVIPCFLHTGLAAGEYPDPNLSKIHDYDYSLSPDFSSATTEYTVNVGDSDRHSILISAETVDSTASFRVFVGNTEYFKPYDGGVYYFITLSPSGITPVDIVVTAGDGITTKKYTVTYQQNHVSDWELLGQRNSFKGNNSPALTVDMNNIPYFACINEGKVCLTKYDTNWVELNIELSGIRTIDLRFSSDNTLYLFTYSENNEVKVYTWKDGSLSQVGETIIEYDTAAYSFELSNDKTPYLAFIDQTCGNRASVKKFDGSGWVNVGNAGISEEEVYDVCIAFGPNNEPYLFYKNYDERASIKKFDGSVWQFIGDQTIFNDRISNIVMSVSPQGIPYIGFNVSDMLNSKAHVWELKDNKWEPLEPCTDGAKSFYWLKIAPDGTPYVLTGKYGQVVYRYNGSDWENVDEECFSDEDVTYTELVISPTGDLYTAFKEKYHNFISVLKYTIPSINTSPSLTEAPDSTPSADIQPLSTKAPDSTPSVDTQPPSTEVPNSNLKEFINQYNSLIRIIIMALPLLIS